MKPATNLLSADAHKRQLLRQFLRQWCGAWFACLVIGGAVFAHQWHVVHAENNGYSAIADQHQQVQREMQRGDALQSRIKTLEAERDRYVSIVNGSVPLSVLGMLGRAAQSAGGELRMNTFAMREVSTPGANRRPDIRRLMLDLEGTAKSDLAVGRFVRVLHTSGVFETVDLKSSRGAATPTGETATRQFRLQCVLPSPEGSGSSQQKSGAKEK